MEGERFLARTAEAVRIFDGYIDALRAIATDGLPLRLADGDIAAAVGFPGFAVLLEGPPPTVLQWYRDWRSANDARDLDWCVSEFVSALRGFYSRTSDMPEGIELRTEHDTMAQLLDALIEELDRDRANLEDRMRDHDQRDTGSTRGDGTLLTAATLRNEYGIPRTRLEEAAKARRVHREMMGGVWVYRLGDVKRAWPADFGH